MHLEGQGAQEARLHTYREVEVRKSLRLEAQIVQNHIPLKDADLQGLGIEPVHVGPQVPVEIVGHLALKHCVQLLSSPGDSKAVVFHVAGRQLEGTMPCHLVKHEHSA